MPSLYQAILLIAFGGPASPEEVRPFVARVTEGISIPPERLEEVVRHYEAVGGQSPLSELTSRQARALQAMLAHYGTPLPVYVGMRNSPPFLVDTMRNMQKDGIRNALGFILSSHRTEASWERYQKNIVEARAELGGNAPAIDYCPGWYDHPRFIQTWAELIEAGFARLSIERRESTPLIFTGHSLPSAMAARSPYVTELETSARMIAERLRHERWCMAYQSRSGKPSDRWLEPDIGTAIGELPQKGAREVVVAPIGFVCDHVEVLYDLDIEARRVAEQLGLRFHRASCPNDHPTFIRMMADVVRQRITAARDET